MVQLPLTPEDRVKAFLNQEVARKGKFADISEYTRECMRKYDDEKFNKFYLGIAKSPTLLDILLKISEEAKNSSKNLHLRKRFWSGKRKTKDSYDLFDKKAFIYINRCCKGSKELFWKYYRFYKDLRRGRFEVYIDYKEEEIPEEFD